MICLITYFARKDGRGLSLYRGQIPLLAEGDSDNMVFPVCSGLQSVKFLYQGPSGRIFDSWDSREEGGKPPPMVKAILTFEPLKEGEPPYVFLTSVAIGSRGSEDPAAK